MKSRGAGDIPRPSTTFFRPLQSLQRWQVSQDSSLCSTSIV